MLSARVLLLTTPMQRKCAIVLCSPFAAGRFYFHGGINFSCAPLSSSKLWLRGFPMIRSWFILCRRQIRLVCFDIFELLSRITPDLLVIRRWLAAVPVLVLLYSPSYSKRPSGRCRISRNRHGMMCMWIPYESNECMFTALSISGRIILNFGVPRLRTSPHFLDFQKFSVTWHRSLRGHDMPELILSACCLVRKKFKAMILPAFESKGFFGWVALAYFDFPCVSLCNSHRPPPFFWFWGPVKLKEGTEIHNLATHFNIS